MVMLTAPIPQSSFGEEYASLRIMLPHDIVAIATSCETSVTMVI